MRQAPAGARGAVSRGSVKVRPGMKTVLFRGGVSPSTPSLWWPGQSRAMAPPPPPRPRPAAPSTADAPAVISCPAGTARLTGHPMLIGADRFLAMCLSCALARSVAVLSVRMILLPVGVDE